MQKISGTGTAGRPERRSLWRTENVCTGRTVTGWYAACAEYFAVDPTIVRLVWAIVTLFGIAPGVIAYIVAAIIIPQNPYV